jgi:hypothetical protein
MTKGFSIGQQKRAEGRGVSVCPLRLAALLSVTVPLTPR